VNPVTVGEIVVGGARLSDRGAGVIESERHAGELAGRLVDLTHRLGIPFIFKAS
jgi:3-deoxy-D-manno-octulosonic acid (KDO) 8-phosphate synthase